MKVHCGKTHKYFGMSLDFCHENQCRITMIDHVDKIVATYDKALGELDDGFSAVKKKNNSARTSAAPDDLFILDNDEEKLSKESSIAFHHLVAKILYVSKHARPDVSTAIAFLHTHTHTHTTRVRAPDINELSHLMEYEG